VAASIDVSSWPVPSVFKLIQKTGGVAQDEMYRVFNMGIGMVVVASPNEAAQLARALPDAYTIGSIVHHDAGERVVLN
jgi:phosphoribosylformylglycinamidine cyclo-ligase